MATVGFFIAHPGDETHTFGAAIRNHIEGGHNVEVFLMTDGRAAHARHILNGYYDCPWHGGKHDLNAEGSSNIHLNAGEFSDLRKQEFVDACLALGVPRAQIHENESLQTEEGYLSEELAATMMEDYGTYYGVDRWKTHSEHDTDPDKRRAGLAARSSSNGQYGIGSDVRYYSDPADNSPVNTSTETCTDEQKVIDAVNVQKTYDPAAAKYGIGYHHAPSKLDAVAADVKSEYHA